MESNLPVVQSQIVPGVVTKESCYILRMLLDVFKLCLEMEVSIL